MRRHSIIPVYEGSFVSARSDHVVILGKAGGLTVIWPAIASARVPEVAVVLWMMAGTAMTP